MIRDNTPNNIKRQLSRKDFATMAIVAMTYMVAVDQITKLFMS